MNITGDVRILKDDKGVYKVTLANKETDFDTNEEKTHFMKIHVKFRKGVEVKNKTKIHIKNGFLTFFRIKTDETYDNGKSKYINFPQIMVLDFDVLEEGIDEVYQRKDYNQNNSNNSAEFYETPDDELPF